MSDKVGNVIPGESEETARAQGWKPETEWKGDPEKWMPADKFLEVGQKVHKVKNDRLERQVREMQNVIGEMRQAQIHAVELGYKRALDDVEKKQREAAANHDLEAYDQAEVEKKQVIREAQETTRKLNATPQTPETDPVFIEWLESNDWYENDEDMAAYAEGLLPRVARETGKKGKPLLDEVTKRTKKAFSSKFYNSRRDDPPTVESGKPSGGGKKGGKSYDDLPSNAKAKCDQFMRQIPGFSKEEYCKYYFQGE